MLLIESMLCWKQNIDLIFPISLKSVKLCISVWTGYMSWSLLIWSLVSVSKPTYWCWSRFFLRHTMSMTCQQMQPCDLVYSITPSMGGVQLNRPKLSQIQHDAVYLEDMMGYSSSPCECHTGFLIIPWLTYIFRHQLYILIPISYSRSLVSVHHKLLIKSVPHIMLMNLRNWVRYAEKNVFCCSALFVDRMSASLCYMHLHTVLAPWVPLGSFHPIMRITQEAHTRVLASAGGALLQWQRMITAPPIQYMLWQKQATEYKIQLNLLL